MAAYTIATSPLDYMLVMHLDEHAHSLHDIRRPNSFRSSDYLPELLCPPCDPRPGWKNDFWVTDRSAPDSPHHRLCRVPGCVQLCRSYGDDPHDKTLESISCSLGCARTLIQHYERTHLSGTTDALHLASTPAPLLDDLILNAHEKDYAAQNLIEIMSIQFIGRPLSRHIIPRNPSMGDRELLHALELALDPSYSDHDSVSSKVYKFACDAWHRGQNLLDAQYRTTTLRSQLRQHHHPAHASLTPTVHLDLSFDEIFDNTIPRPAVDFLHLDHRLGELLRVDVFVSTPTMPSSHSFPASSSGSANPIELELELAQSVDSVLYDANAPTSTESAENVALTFISSDHLAILNELTQGVEPIFDCQNKSAECLPYSKPPLFRGRFLIRLLKGIGDHVPFTTYSIDPPETFPTKKLATSNAVRSFFNMYPEFLQAAPRNRTVPDRV
jgi:hypothetical protein